MIFVLSACGGGAGQGPAGALPGAPGVQEGGGGGAAAPLPPKADSEIIQPNTVHVPEFRVLYGNDLSKVFTSFEKGTFFTFKSSVLNFLPQTRLYFPIRSELTSPWKNLGDSFVLRIIYSPPEGSEVVDKKVCKIYLQETIEQYEVELPTKVGTLQFDLFQNLSKDSENEARTLPSSIKLSVESECFKSTPVVFITDDKFTSLGTLELRYLPDLQQRPPLVSP